jgi:hypothetical protein
LRFDMATRAPREPFLIEVKFSKRDDGGLRAECDALPGFFLSHSDPDLVIADVAPALGVILSEMLSVSVLVEPLRDLNELSSMNDDALPAHLCSEQRYVGTAARIDLAAPFASRGVGARAPQLWVRAAQGKNAFEHRRVVADALGWVSFHGTS